MNCPIHRTKMWYEPLLSAPNTIERKKVYYCSSCLTLYIFLNKPLKSTIGGVVVMRMGKIKRAGYLEVEDVDRSSRGGEGDLGLTIPKGATKIFLDPEHKILLSG